MGNATLLVILLAAVAWRLRHSSRAVGAALTAGIAVKLFLVPVGLWLLLARRFRAAALTALGAPLLVLISWAAIRFDSLTDYPAILSRGGRVRGPDGVLVQAYAQRHGASPGLALLIAAVPAAVLFAAACRRRGDELACFTLCIAGTLLLSPICWIYYLGLLIVPLAIRHPTLSREWGGFTALWLLVTSQKAVAIVAVSAWLVWRLVQPRLPSGTEATATRLAAPSSA